MMGIDGFSTTGSSHVRDVREDDYWVIHISRMELP